MKDRRSVQASRREFLAATAALAASALAPRESFAQAGGQAGSLAGDPLRPQFHLLPAKNWMNDPNGPIYWNGRYHMFFQYNPHGAVWGDMSWNHAVSRDMMHWTHLPLALTMTPGGPDAAGCFTGSCLPVGKRVYAVYTGVVDSTPEKATIRDGSDKLEESQCLAYSDDPQLVRWTKLPQPIVPEPPPGMRVTGFRDPSAWKQEDWYYMTVGSGEAKVGGCVLLYRSKDMKQWSYLHHLTSGTWTGKPATNPCDSGEMWECPEFFALDGGHVLIYSSVGKVFWQTGRLDAKAMTFAPTKTGELDLGAFYAPKTQLDAEGRRILWGWIPEKRPDAALKAAGWAGMMSLPRVLRLAADGTLRMEALPALASLRGPALGGGRTITLPRANGELLCSGVAGKGFALTMRYADAGLLRAIYEPEKQSLTLDDHTIAMGADEAPTLHAFVDGSVIEVIVNGRVGYTKRFYYEQSQAPAVQVELSGMAEARAWSVQPISNNRLTTPAQPGA